MVEFPIDEAYIIGTWCSSALWGTFSVLFGYSMWSIFMSRNGRSRNDVTTATVIVLYLLATAQLAMALRRLLEAFIFREGFVGPYRASLIYMADISLMLSKVKDLIYITTLCIGDMVVIWRCYMVWNRSFIVISVPLLMWLGTAVAGYGCMGHYFVPHNGPWIQSAVAWATSMFAVSLVTNIFVTLLTAGRIWWLIRSSNGLPGYSSRRYRNIIFLIIESGAVIAAAKLIEFILFETVRGDGTTGNNAFYVIFECMPQIMGIVPTMIIAAVNAKMSVIDTHTTSILPVSRPIVFTEGRARMGMGIDTTTDTMMTTQSGVGVFSLEPIAFGAREGGGKGKEGERKEGEGSWR